MVIFNYQFNQQKMDIQDFSSRTIRNEKVIAFSLTYNGIELEGQFIFRESIAERYEKKVEIDYNSELTDEDYDNIHDWVIHNVDHG
jgi:hypothetical protein